MREILIDSDFSVDETTLKINKVSLANDGSPIIFAQEVLAYGVEEDYGNA